MKWEKKKICFAIWKICIGRDKGIVNLFQDVNSVIYPGIKTSV